MRAFTGISWLGGSSLTPVSGLNQTAQALLSVPLADMAMIICYLWIWAGFAMVLIGAGLASLNREVLEAARIDGAKEWQVFRRVTVPMLSPVLAVVFVTMIINVLKVFDIVLNMASGSSVNATPTLAVEIYNDGFTGGVHSGVSSAIAVILFLLVTARDDLEPQADQGGVMANIVETTDLTPRRRGLARRLGTRGPANIVLGLIAIVWLVPTVSLLVISLRPEADFGVSGWWKALLHPLSLTFSNYHVLFAQGFVAGGLLDSLITSLEITIPATLLVTFLACFAGHSLVFGRWRGRDIVFLVVVGLMVVPVQVALIPVVQFYRELGDLFGLNPYGTIPGVVIFHVAFGLPFGIFLMRNFMSGIPKDLLEAARMEGAGEWKVFYRIVLPLALPALASLAIFQFIWVWNDLLVALVFLGGNLHTPLTVFLYDQNHELQANYWIISTGAIVSVVVPLIVFFSFQRYFVRGVLAGAVK